MSTPPLKYPSRPVWAAVLPAAPKDYDQAWMARLTDIVNKVIEQLVEPRQINAATAVFSDLPQETPRLGIEGEIYTKECLTCGCITLAINQNITEIQQHAQRRWIRTRVTPADARDFSNPHDGASGEGTAGGTKTSGT